VQENQNDKKIIHGDREKELEAHWRDRERQAKRVGYALWVSLVIGSLTVTVYSEWAHIRSHWAHIAGLTEKSVALVTEPVGQIHIPSQGEDFKFTGVVSFISASTDTEAKQVQIDKEDDTWVSIPAGEYSVMIDDLKCETAELDQKTIVSCIHDHPEIIRVLPGMTTELNNLHFTVLFQDTELSLGKISDEEILDSRCNTPRVGPPVPPSMCRACGYTPACKANEECISLDGLVPTCLASCQSDKDCRTGTVCIWMGEEGSAEGLQRCAPEKLFPKKKGSFL
jgi:hypothetical protein